MINILKVRRLWISIPLLLLRTSNSTLKPTSIHDSSGGVNTVGSSEATVLLPLHFDLGMAVPLHVLRSAVGQLLRLPSPDAVKAQPGPQVRNEDLSLTPNCLSSVRLLLSTALPFSPISHIARSAIHATPTETLCNRLLRIVTDRPQLTQAKSTLLAHAVAEVLLWELEAAAADSSGKHLMQWLRSKYTEHRCAQAWTNPSIQCVLMLPSSSLCASVE